MEEGLTPWKASSRCILVCVAKWYNVFRASYLQDPVTVSVLLSFIEACSLVVHSALLPSHIHLADHQKPPDRPVGPCTPKKSDAAAAARQTRKALSARASGAVDPRLLATANLLQWPLLGSYRSDLLGLLEGLACFAKHNTHLSSMNTSEHSGIICRRESTGISSYEEETHAYLQRVEWDGEVLAVVHKAVCDTCILLVM